MTNVEKLKWSKSEIRRRKEAVCGNIYSTNYAAWKERPI
jgi:hypothetical protein